MSHREGINQEPGTIDVPTLADRELLVEYLEGDLLVERGIAVAEPGEALEGLPRTRRTGDRQRPFALILEYHPQQQEGPAGNVIAMQMRDENPVELGGANPGMVKTETDGRAGVYQYVPLGQPQQDCLVVPPLGMPGISCSEKMDFRLFHIPRLPALRRARPPPPAGQPARS